MKTYEHLSIEGEDPGYAFRQFRKVEKALESNPREGSESYLRELRFQILESLINLSGINGLSEDVDKRNRNFYSPLSFGIMDRAVALIKEYILKLNPETEINSDYNEIFEE